MKTIVITGATSFIGFHLLQQLYFKDCSIYAVVRPGSKNLVRLELFPKVTIIFCDIEEIISLDVKLPERIDVFYHLAWEGARRPHRDDEKMQANNYEAALVAYAVAHKKGCRKFIGVGSQAEYGKITGLITEDCPARPETMYGKYKLKAEQDLLEAGKHNQVDIIWPRIFSVYGYYDNPDTLIMTAIKKMKRNERIALTECKQNWNYIYVKDIAKMLCLVGSQECETGIYNFASPDNRILEDYVKELKKVTHSDSFLDFGAVPYGPEGVVSFQPDITKFIKNFPAFTFVNFKDGIRELLAYEKI